MIFRVDLSGSYGDIHYDFTSGDEALAFVTTAMEHCTSTQRYTIHVKQEEEKETTEE